MKIIFSLSILLAHACLFPRLGASRPDTVSAPAQEEPRSVLPSAQPFRSVDLTRLDVFHRELCFRLMGQLQEPGFRTLLERRLQALDPGSGPVTGLAELSLITLAADYAAACPTETNRGFAAQLHSLNEDLLRKKCIPRDDLEILGLDVLWPPGVARTLDWDQVLFVVRPQGPVDQLEAYDLRGRSRALAVERPPTVPVFMVGMDAEALLPTEAALVNQELERAGLSKTYPPASVDTPLECGKLIGVNLFESAKRWWWTKRVTTYALVVGIDPAQDKPNIRMVDLPYLTELGTTYHPNQLVVFWNDYRYQAVNLQFWRKGYETNYRDIVSAILQAVSVAMSLGGAGTFAWIPKVADLIVQASPAHWWLDTDSCIDSFYTLEKGNHYTWLTGAANQAAIGLVPFQLKPL